MMGILGIHTLDMWNPPSHFVSLNLQVLWLMLRKFEYKKVVFLWINSPLILSSVILFSYTMQIALSEIEIKPF